MPLPDPTFESAKGVFRLGEASLRRTEQDEPFIQAVREEFPILVSRQVLPPEAPFEVPYLALHSGTGSSRLALSTAGAEFDVRFYGDFNADRERCFDYLRRKLHAAMAGWTALELRPAFFGLVLTLNYSFAEMGDSSSAEYLVRAHTRYEVDASELQEALVRVGFKVDDAYYLILALTNYETKTLERAVFPGQQRLQVKPWEGEVVDRGIQLTVDVNNRLSAIMRREDPVVDVGDVDAILSLEERLVADAAATFVESGTVQPAELIQEEEA